jgi:hypothetical protein
LKIIEAVYLLKSAESETVFNHYKIHGYYCYGFNSIHLKVQSELPEIQNLVNNIIPTGNDELDFLLNKYHFNSTKTSFSYPRSNWMTIYSDKEYNMIPVENEFNNLSQVIIAEFDKYCGGDGNTIELKRKNDTTITFSIGSVDCPSGCIYHKYWQFKIEDGVAKFIKTYEN